MKPTSFCKKVCYPNRKVARKFQKILTIKFGQKHNIYFCKKCNGYHLTTHKAELIAKYEAKVLQHTPKAEAK